MTYYSFPGIRINPATGSIQADRVLSAASKTTGIPVSVIISKTRKRNVVETRQLCWLVMHGEFNIRKVSIGKLFGKSHTTIGHGIEKCSSLLKVDPLYKSSYSLTLRTLWKL